MKLSPLLLIAAVLLPPLIFGFQNCGGGFVVDDQLSSLSGSSSATAIESDPLLKQQSLAILQLKCASCHQTAALGNVTNIMDLNHLVSSGLITPGDPTQGRLVGSIVGGTMPPVGTPAVTAQELTTIRNWITSVRLVGAVPVGGAIIPNGMTVGTDAALSTTAARILQVNCAGCHQSNADGGISKILSVDNIVSTGLVVMGDPTKGRLLGSIVDRSMPPTGSRLVVSAADQTSLQSWIRSMKLVPLDPANPPRAVLPVLAPTYASISANILIPKCTGCHGSARADSNIRYDSFAATLRTVTVNNGANSRLYTDCLNGSMPDAPFKRLSADELAAIKLWIDTGALNN